MNSTGGGIYTTHLLDKAVGMEFGMPDASHRIIHIMVIAAAWVHGQRLMSVYGRQLAALPYHEAIYHEAIYHEEIYGEEIDVGETYDEEIYGEETDDGEMYHKEIDVGEMYHKEIDVGEIYDEEIYHEAIDVGEIDGEEIDVVVATRRHLCL